MRLTQSLFLRVSILVLLAFGPVVPAPAQLSVSLLPDSVSVAGGAILAVASLGFHPSVQEMPVDVDLVNGFDRLAMFGYSRGLDMTSDILQYAAFALPLALALGISQDQAIAGGVIYF